MKLSLVLLTLFTVAPIQAQEPQTAAPKRHTVYIRGGRSVDPMDMLYRPVVALVREYRKFNEKTQRFENYRAICSGTVLNRKCILSAQHCAEGPGEENISITVYAGSKIEDGNKVASVSRALVRGERKMESDIALLQLDVPLSEDQTLYTSNLHDGSKMTLLADTQANIVGYGVFNSNWDEKTRTWTDVGAGEKRDGDVKIIKAVSNRDPLVEVEPTKGNHSAAPGDSGGPLMRADNGQTTVYGVTGSIDSPYLTNVHKNYYTSVAYHRPWIVAATEELGCTESTANKLNLEEFVQKQIPDYGEAQKKISSFTRGEPDYQFENFEARLWNAADLSKFRGADLYTGIKILSAGKDARGNLLIRWEGILGDIPGLELDVMRRNGIERKASGEFRIPPVPRLREPVFRQPKIK